MSFQPSNDRYGKDLVPGAQHYRAFIGPPQKYDLLSAMQFNLLTALGMREDHTLLDIGCGSLRGGKLSIAYLLPNKYYGIEPEQWLLEEGIESEIGKDLIKLKRPTFSHDRNFTLSAFDQKFDFILAQSIFSHTSPSQIKRCLTEAKKVMKPSSIFVATFLEGDANYLGEEWVYPGCVTFTAEFIADLVQQQGLVCKPLQWHHPNGQSWIAIVNPGYEQRISVLNENVLYLRDQLDRAQKRVVELEKNPVVRVGIGLNKILRYINQTVRKKRAIVDIREW